MPYSLVRERDGAGDSGQMSLAITPNAAPGDEHLYEHAARPKIGAAMRVGSLYARSFSAQDWWQTTVITEILEEGEDEDGVEFARFKTGNSTYMWKHF